MVCGARFAAPAARVHPANRVLPRDIADAVHGAAGDRACGALAGTGVDFVPVSGQMGIVASRGRFGGFVQEACIGPRT